MEGLPKDEYAEIELELQRFPLSLIEEYHRAEAPMRESLSEQQRVAWGREGVSIARQTVRSWEAAQEFFRVSPETIGLLPFNYFLQWAQCGGKLCLDSPTLSIAYFKSSSGTLGKLRPRYIEGWSQLGRMLYKGTWKSSSLSCRFFETSPFLLEGITYRELELFVSFLDSLSHRSSDLATECLLLGGDVFPNIGQDKEAFISLAEVLVEASWRDIRALFETGAKALPKVEKGQRARFLALAERLASQGGVNIPAFLSESSDALFQLDGLAHPLILSLSERLVGDSPEAMVELVKSAPLVLSHIPLHMLEQWFDYGVAILSENNDGGLAYFKVESSRSEEVLELLSSGVEFTKIKDIIRMYCRALAGTTVEVATVQELAGKNIGWVSKENPTTEGNTIFLPAVSDKYQNKEQNFSWYKVVSTHQTAHLEFGSFDFEFERPSILFKDKRPLLEQLHPQVLPQKDNEDVPEGFAVTAERGWLTDMQRFFDRFEDRKLALDIFTVVEDGRIDARVKREYAGIRAAYSGIQGDALGDRPEITSLPLREAMVEFLVRLSLQQYRRLTAPQPYVNEARTIARIAKQVLPPTATVEDSAEATLRIYAIISQLPNEELPPEDWESMDMDQEEDEYVDSEEMEQLLQQLGAQMGPQSEEESYQSPQEVEYRGDFKPELVQLLARLRMVQQEQRGQSAEGITQEMLEELLKNSAELEMQAIQGDIQDNASLFANNIMKEAGVTPPPTREYRQGPLVHVDEEGGSLETTEPQAFLYDEWDFRANDYKPRWCIVREKTMGEGDPAFYSDILKNNQALVNKTRKQFEMLMPEMFRKVRRLPDGEEFELDAVIEAIVDKRTGNPPSDNIYWRRNKVQRDVAVVFLLDMSASTAEAIEDSKRPSDEWNAPNDPVEYMVWLRSRRDEGSRRTYKRIVDLEKESLVLMCNSLELLGDTYGVYGFSGYGRENVEYYVIKDLNEGFNDTVKRRIDRISPLHATRMGPAIRHATSKLARQDSRTKLLFLISDGRPQDRGYSREGVEKEYAVHDTKMALIEARNKNITPFCLTVDKAGHDYLKTMCQDMGYEILGDIRALPERLPFLYRKLTV